MNTTRFWLGPVTLLACSLVVACSQSGAEPSVQAASQPAASSQPGASSQAASSQPNAASQPGTSKAHDELAELDHRMPVPLQPMMAWHQKQNMMQHLESIQGITAALAKEDWEAIAVASKPIESSPQMQQMCQHMGAGADGFTELALEFHNRANGIAKAAATHNTKAVLLATSNTLQACTSCHSKYRQDVVGAATWQERTGSDHIPNPEAHH